MNVEAQAWFATHSSRSDQWPLETLLAAKGNTRISVVLPALDEEATVGSIVASIRSSLMTDRLPLVDELIVLDSGSTDATASVAAGAGATVISRDDAVRSLPAVRGKGEAMWRSLFVTTGDVLVFVDADLNSFDPSYVTGLVGPLLTDPTIALVKGYYDRPVATSDDADTSTVGGGRVTELVARPLLNLHWPQLSGVVQPLAGEYAARRSLLEQLPFPSGYGVELGLLVDTLRLEGVDAIAQVDLGVRRHRHQDLNALGRMSAQIWQTALDRLDRDGRVVVVQEPEAELTQFETNGDAHVAHSHPVAPIERPPANTVQEYRERLVRP